jgi:hypothetical protein
MKKSNKLEKLKELLKLQRINVKVDLTFWVLKPYTEEITYEINREFYKPVSYRFLCFALVVLGPAHKIPYEADEDVKKAFKKYSKH